MATFAEIVLVLRSPSLPSKRRNFEDDGRERRRCTGSERLGSST
jgi:hypothetical protein